ncbi:MAG: SH3 domain-containing protein [Caulobacteraceae bacterium]|nr:MAG: SH3 domain-containing protein [Caulobacteraceae bacterium]
MRKFIAISAGALIAVSLAGAAQAGVVNCDVKGSRQGKGALIGAIAGAVIGNNVSHSNGAPIIGGLAGAAAGSAIGCEQEKMKARDQANASYYGNHMATTTVKIREAPSTRAPQVGSLARGERIDVIRYEGDWAVVGYHGNYGSRTTGYVAASYLRPVR